MSGRDDEGRPTRWTTHRDPEFNDNDRAWFHALRDYQADLHSCGRPLTESLKVDGEPGPKYMVGTRICRACMALDSHHKRQEAADRGIREKGFHPESYRLLQVFTEDEAQQATRQQSLTQQPSLKED